MTNLIKGQFNIWQIDEITSCKNSKFTLPQVGETASWQNDKLAKCSSAKNASKIVQVLLIDNLVKFQTDEIANWRNGKFS
jgi:hypothetical protein